MKFDVSKIVKAEGAFLDISVEVDLGKIEFSGQEFSFVEPVRVEGIIKNAGGNLYLEATVKSKFMTSCARCLKELTEEFTYEVDECFSKGELEEDSVFLQIVSNTIDLRSVVEDNFCTSVPFVFLCSDDCKGLCHTCGKNLNDGDCDCENEEIDPRLAGLKAFLKND